MKDLETRAKAFATERHAAIGQIRKYTGEPYINHPAAVAELVRGIEHDEEMLAAAWLHDTVEDTETTIDEIFEQFGTRVGNYVDMLTDISVPEDGNRKQRKCIDREHTATAHANAKSIKLADLIDNSESITAHDPKFAKVYMAEKSLLLDVLYEGNSKLWMHAKVIIDDYEAMT